MDICAMVDACKNTEYLGRGANPLIEFSHEKN
jgi:hypothetical protein